MNKYLTPILTFSIALLIIAGVWSNVLEKKSVDKTKLPLKVEESRGFQRWINNLKNKGFDIKASYFFLEEESEIYNLKWVNVYSVDDEEAYENYQNTLENLQDTQEVIFSPSGRLLIDFRDEVRGNYGPNEVHFLGQRDDKIIDARILDCSVRSNCYFDRAYFLSNDVFVISEISRNINKRDENVGPCGLDDTCEYVFKVHVVDLVNNKRLVYKSPAFEGVISKIIPEL